jgi:tetratricopeptide (TPR) repeat protein
MSEKDRRLGIWLSIFAVIALAALAPFGCVPQRSKSSPAQVSKSAEPAVRPIDETTQVFELIRSLNSPAAIEKDPTGRPVGNSYVTKAIYFLKQWLARQDFEAAGDKWQLDPLFNQMPRSLREHPLFARLGELDYYQTDILYLQQCLWQNDIAQRVTAEPRSAALEPWFKELEQAGQIDGARQLAQAERIFDWTVRNIQLKPLLPPAKGPELSVEEGKRIDTRSPAERGVPGPGYQQLPQQTLLYGQGDAWERGRIFIQVCRQAGVPAMMLGISQPNELGGPQAWACAVFIPSAGGGSKGELYLFDPQLGLPIPGPKRQGIATLTNCVEDESLLAALVPSGGEPYRVSQDDLKNVGILLDVQPEALLRRMLVLEAPLNEARKQSRSEPKSPTDDQNFRTLPIVLAQKPSDLEPALRKLKHIGTVGLWRVPFEAIQFQQAMPEVAAKDPEMNKRLGERQGMFHGETMIYLGATQTVDRSQVEGQQVRQRTPRQVTLSQGRDYSLRGRFEDLDTRPGARSVYLSFRPSEQIIDFTETSIKNADEMAARDPSSGLLELWQKNPEMRAVAMAHMGRLMRQSKSHATYWLGLSYLETGEYENAIQWLEPLAKNPALAGELQAGARYATARSYEALGKLDQAKELYLADDSPQAVGNKLRAEWLK